MTRATKSAKRTETPATTAETAASETPTTEVATPDDDRGWMLDLFDWPMVGWPSLGRLTSLFDREGIFGARTADAFPMRVEQFHDGDDLVVRAELPGIDPEHDVEIAVEGRRLTIDATREDRRETDDGHRSEFRYGRFHRSMTLPTGADADAVAATYADGILEVRVPVHTDADATRKVMVTRG